MVKFLERGFGVIALILAAAVILLGPWCFGAWEMWGFWPFATALFIATACLGVHAISVAILRAPAVQPDAAASPYSSRQGWRLLLAFLPFLVYAFIRFRQAPVYLLAERAFLLHLTALLVAAIIIATAGTRVRRVLFALIALDLFWLGAYGIANHFITGNRYVLWVPGYAQYTIENRATGSYFCPDHFSGIMELGVCAGLASLLLGRGWLVRTGGVVLSLLAIWGVVLSKSRGGGLTLAVVAVAALVWGLAHLPRAARVWCRLSAASALLCVAVVVACFAQSFVQRYGQYVGWSAASGRPPREAVAFMLGVLRRQDRPVMFAAAYRAWRTQPWVGVGPGMQSVLWPHFAPSPDGDRAQNRWPTLLNNTHTANAVHNDWMQLLEETGLIGFLLFVLPVGCVVRALTCRLRAAGQRLVARPGDETARDDALFTLAALLALVAMGFHSLGDFNLQMPATAWLLAALVALPFAAPAPPNAREANARA